MTFSESADVSALYRQRQRTQARFSFLWAYFTARSTVQVPMSPDVRAVGRTEVQWAEKGVRFAGAGEQPGN